jgi:hypothetical protein
MLEHIKELMYKSLNLVEVWKTILYFYEMISYSKLASPSIPVSIQQTKYISLLLDYENFSSQENSHL